MLVKLPMDDLRDEPTANQQASVCSRRATVDVQPFRFIEKYARMVHNVGAQFRIG